MTATTISTVETSTSLGHRLRELAPALLAAEERGDAAGRLDPGTLEALRASGLLGATLPADLGGPGLTLLDYVSLISDLARIAPSAALLAVMPNGTIAVTRVPERLVPEGERAAFRRRREAMAAHVLAGRIYGVANTEPGTGGDMLKTKTVAVRGADGTVRLTGFKSFASFGPKADVWMCAARDSDGQVDAWLVPGNAPGVSYTGGWNALGMRGTESIGIHLADAPAEDLLGYRGMLEGANARHYSALGFAAVFIGTARAALDEARRALGSSAWGDVKLAEAAVRVEAAEALVESVARAGNDWPLPPGYSLRATMAKAFAAETGVAAAETALLVLGGGAYAKGSGRPARLLRDALAGPLLRPPLPLAYETIARALRSV